jgi:hypothetical protein
VTFRRVFLVAGLALAQLLGPVGAGAAAEPREVLVEMPGEGELPVLLFLPLNVSVVMPAEMSARSPLVREAIEAYLTEQPFELKTVAFESARSLWLASIRNVRSGEKGARAGYDDAARAFVQELAKHAEFDHVIAPSLYLREAPVARGYAEWDGVRRLLKVDAEGAENRKLVAAVPFEGVAPAASLHVAVFDGKGEKLQEQLGGLDLIARVFVPRKPDPETGEPTVEFLPRDDFFSDPEQLREGIALALTPFLTPIAAGD